MELTKRGKIIYDYFKNNPSLHPSAEEVYNELKKQDISIGVATVYRNLKKLVEQGVLREINLEKQGVRYDLQEHEHYHFICEQCGRIQNITLPSLQQMNKDIENIIKGVITSKDVMIYGVCENCINKQEEIQN